MQRETPIICPEKEMEKKSKQKKEASPQAPFLYFIFILAALPPPLPHFLCFSRPNTNCSLYHITATASKPRQENGGGKTCLCHAPPKKKHQKSVLLILRTASIFTPAKLVLSLSFQCVVITGPEMGPHQYSLPPTPLKATKMSRRTGVVVFCQLP